MPRSDKRHTRSLAKAAKGFASSESAEVPSGAIVVGGIIDGDAAFFETNDPLRLLAAAISTSRSGASHIVRIESNDTTFRVSVDSPNGSTRTSIYSSSTEEVERPQEKLSRPQEKLSLFLPETPILLHALVEPIGKVDEGSIIQVIRPAWLALLAELAKDPHALRRLTPRQIEELVAASYEQAGFDEVILTPRSGDLGRDVIATRRDFCTVRIIDQVKHYAPHHRVSADDVRALLGVLLSDERATKGFVTTTSTFAPGVSSDKFISKYVPSRLELVDGKALLGRLLSHPSPKR